MSILRRWHYNPDPHNSLSLAIAAWAARRAAPPEFRERSSIFEARAVRILRDEINYGTFEPSDMFASNFLGWLSYTTCSRESTASVHFTGSLALLRLFLDPPAARFRIVETSVSTFLNLFGPFIIDCANAWTVRNGETPIRNTSFSQRSNNFNELLRVDDAGLWCSGILEAANSTLGNVLEVLLVRICEVAKGEEEGDFARDGVQAAIQYVREELADVDLRDALRTIHASFHEIPLNHTTVERQMVTRLFHRLRSSLFVLALLENQSIQVGIKTPKARFLSKVIIQFCYSHAIRRGGPIEDYYLISWHNFSHLLLGGLGLSNEYQYCTYFGDEANRSAELGYSRACFHWEGGKCEEFTGILGNRGSGTSS